MSNNNAWKQYYERMKQHVERKHSPEFTDDSCRECWRPTAKSEGMTPNFMNFITWFLGTYAFFHYTNKTAHYFRLLKVEEDSEETENMDTINELWMRILFCIRHKKEINFDKIRDECKEKYKTTEGFTKELS